ncbi:MAG: Holliday junction branch migration protein RuvA [Candidatus Susulua stagnicola]|nr:Holliday junction branch migration protein RuvA [Candidatus Susulua stagnicola]
MIYQVKGKLIKKEENRVIVDISGIAYEINTPPTVSQRLGDESSEVALVIYHYFKLDKNRGTPVMVGFIEELERDFFEKFISVSGVGPKAALKAFDKPVARIAQAIEENDESFLQSLTGIGKQRAKQIIAHLQGKVGRFALIKEGQLPKKHLGKEIVAEAKEILKRLQYKSVEADLMIKQALEKKPEIDNSEELLNEIYRQRK